LTEALKALDNDSARAHAIAVENGQSFELVVDGQTLTVAPDEVLVETSSPDGYAVAEENGVLAALDTTLTPDLVAEGIAREVVRYIQDARKNAGFAISDRIDVVIDGVEQVSNEDAFDMARKAARVEGIPVGISSGAALVAAFRQAALEENAGKTIVAIIPSFAERYLSTALFEGL
jgi:threonine synthase